MDTFSQKISALQHNLTPLSKKIESQRQLSSLKKGMMDVTIVLLIGSVFAMLLLFSQVQWVGANFLSQWQSLWKMMITGTYGMLGLYIAISISYHHSKQVKTPMFQTVFLSSVAVVICHYVFFYKESQVGYVKLDNIFIGIVVAILTVELLGLLQKKGESNSLGWIPIGSRQRCYQIVTACLYLCLLALITFGCRQVVESSQLSAKVMGSILSFDSPLTIFIIILLEMLFWFIGLNGYSILAAVVLPIATTNLVANTNLLLAGKSATYILTPNFWDYFAGMSGSGLVGGLAVLAMFSQVKSLKIKGRVAIIPSLFHISEPILYGLPIAYNAYFFVPFVIGTPILAVAQWYVFKWGWLKVPAYHVADLPLPVAQVLSTMDWRAIILVLVIFGLSILMYYPFFKMYEKQVIKTELALEQEDPYADLDLDF